MSIDMTAHPAPPQGNPSATTGATAKTRRPTLRILLVLKIAISVGLLFFLLSVVGTQSVTSRLAAAKLWPLLLTLAVLMSNGVLAAARWQILSRLAGASMGRWLAVQLTFSGLFFGQVLPGAVGGDAVRGWLGWRAGMPLFGFATSIVLDRLVSLVASIALVCAAMPSLMRVAPSAMAWAPPVFGGALVLGMVAVLSVDRLPLPAFARRAPFDRLLATLQIARTALISRAAAPAYVLALILQLTTVMSVFLVAQSLNISISLLDCVTVVPAIVFITMLPISFNGWGVREGAMAVGLGLFGVASSDAVVLSILFGGCLIVASLPGAVLWLTISPTGKKK